MLRSARASATSVLDGAPVSRGRRGRGDRRAALRESALSGTVIRGLARFRGSPRAAGASGPCTPTAKADEATFSERDAGPLPASRAARESPASPETTPRTLDRQPGRPSAGVSPAPQLPGPSRAHGLAMRTTQICAWNVRHTFSSPPTHLAESTSMPVILAMTSRPLHRNSPTSSIEMRPEDAPFDRHWS